MVAWSDPPGYSMQETKEERKRGGGMRISQLVFSGRSRTRCTVVGSGAVGAFDERLRSKHAVVRGRQCPMPLTCVGASVAATIARYVSKSGSKTIVLDKH